VNECVGCGARGAGVQMREVKVAATGYVYKALLCAKCAAAPLVRMGSAVAPAREHVCKSCGEPVFKSNPTGPGRYPSLCGACR
jgi:hypothetical protein